MPDTSAMRIIRETDSAPGTLALRLHPRPDLPAVTFLTLWLVAWAIGEAVVLWQLIAGDVPVEIALFMLVWLALWTYGGLLALSIWLWQLGGVERLTLTPDTVTISRAFPLCVRDTRCDATAVANLRLTQEQSYPGPTSHLSQGPFAPPGEGTILFDHHGQRIGFGLGLDRDAARDLLALIHARFPDLSPPEHDPAAS